MTDLVYLSTNGVKSHIKSVENFDKVGFDWDKIVVKSPEEVNTIPVGISASFFRRLSD